MLHTGEDICDPGMSNWVISTERASGDKSIGSGGVRCKLRLGVDVFKGDGDSRVRSIMTTLCRATYSRFIVRTL